MESEVREPGEAGEPTPTPSPAGSSTSSPAGDATLEAAWQKIAQLEAQMRAAQSNKDKGVARVGREVKVLSEQFARYEQYREKFGSPEEAQRQMAIDDFLAERNGTERPAAAVPAPAGVAPAKQAPSVDADALELLGLGRNDADVIASIADGKTSLQDFVALAKARKAKAPPPNDATVLPSGGGSSVNPDLQAEYQSRLKGMQGNVDAIAALKTEYRKKGLQVW